MKTQLLLTTIFSGFISSAQNPTPRNTIYLEAGGNGLFGSVNYERQLTKTPGLGLRLGTGFYGEKGDFFLTIPVGINYLFRLRERSFLDAGLGVTWARQDAKIFSNELPPGDEHMVHFVPSIGFRRHTAKNLMWRIAITPVANRKTFVPWLGLSIGKLF